MIEAFRRCPLASETGSLIRGTVRFKRRSLRGATLEIQIEKMELFEHDQSCDLENLRIALWFGLLSLHRFQAGSL